MCILTIGTLIIASDGPLVIPLRIAPLRHGILMISLYVTRGCEIGSAVSVW